MKTTTKRMLLGIFLMLLSIWCLIFGVADDLPLSSAVGVFLPVPAIICFFWGFCGKDGGKGNDT